MDKIWLCGSFEGPAIFPDLLFLIHINLNYADPNIKKNPLEL